MKNTENISLDDSAYSRVHASFMQQTAGRLLGMELEKVSYGIVQISLPYSEKVTQQQGGFHGGAIGMLADNAAGYAGLTAAPDGMEVVTVEYKINFLNNRAGGRLLAVGNLLKKGSRLIVTTADIVHIADDGVKTPCAYMVQTLTPVTKTY